MPATFEEFSPTYDFFDYMTPRGNGEQGLVVLREVDGQKPFRIYVDVFLSPLASHPSGLCINRQECQVIHNGATAAGALYYRQQMQARRRPARVPRQGLERAVSGLLDRWNYERVGCPSSKRRPMEISNSHLSGRMIMSFIMRLCAADTVVFQRA